MSAEFPQVAVNQRAADLPSERGVAADKRNGCPWHDVLALLREVKFSGVVVPTVKKLVYGIDIKRVMRSKLVLGIADGWMSADGSIIYRAFDLKVGLVRDIAAHAPAAS